MADNAEKDKKDNSFMMKLATLIVDKRKGFYLIFIVLCIFCVLSMNRVKVNNDLTTYLPDTTETRRGLDLMDSEFTTYGSARILICNVKRLTRHRNWQNSGGGDGRCQHVGFR